jgi:hypothetical protein
VPRGRIQKKYRTDDVRINKRGMKWMPEVVPVIGFDVRQEAKRKGDIIALTGFLEKVPSNRFSV